MKAEVADILEAVLLCRRDALVCRNDWSGAAAFIPYNCGRKFCPSCVQTWSDDLRARMMPTAAAVPWRELRHLVLTLPNAKPGSLAETVDRLFTAWRRWKDDGRRIKRGGWLINVAGYAVKMEVDVCFRRRLRRRRDGSTYIQEPGWHPHLHILLHAPQGFTFDRESLARAAWCSHADADPAAQFITAPKSPNIACEVAKYAAKPLQLENMPPDFIAEAAEALHKRRFTQSTGSLHLAAPESGEGDWIYHGRIRVLMDQMHQAGPEGDEAARLVEEFVWRNRGDPRLFERIPALKPLWQQLLQGHTEPGQVAPDTPATGESPP